MQSKTGVARLALATGAPVIPVGHWGAGKFFEDMQRLGAYLARRGFVVLIYDSAGQGERQQYWDPVMSRTLLSPGTSQWATSPTMTVVKTTRPVASVRIGRRAAMKSRNGMSQPSAKSSG